MTKEEIALQLTLKAMENMGSPQRTNDIIKDIPEIFNGIYSKIIIQEPESK